MTVRTRKEAIAVASKQTRNTPGTCQLNTRAWFNAPSAGDRDRDGDADAVDGWLSEPVSKRHVGDRNPPPGVPLAWSGGSKGYGHRALSDVNSVISTDMLGNQYRAGYTSHVTGRTTSEAIGIIERSMGVKYLGWSETITGLSIPEEKKPVVKPRHLKRKFAEVSLQFSDSDKQHTQDIEKIFSQGFHHILGTEAGPGAGNTTAELKRCADKYGYRISITDRYDTWVAVKKSLIVSGSWKAGAEFVLWRSSRTTPKPPSVWGDKAIVWGQYEDKDLGIISLGSLHTLTHRGAGPKYKKESDRKFAEVAQAWGKKHASGNKIAFIGGDFNNSDRTMDYFFGGDFTSCWDELKVYPNTGHGNIDAVASWDKDGRVECIAGRVRNDSKFFLHTDHFLMVATYQIRTIK